MNLFDCGQNFRVSCLTTDLLISPAQRTQIEMEHILTDVNTLVSLTSMNTISKVYILTRAYIYMHIHTHAIHTCIFGGLGLGI